VRLLLFPRKVGVVIHSCPNNTSVVFAQLIGLYGAVLLVLSGCAVGPNFKRPEPPVVESYTTGSLPAETLSADGKAQRFDRNGGIPVDWWRLFNSPTVDRTVNEALERNQSLQSAQASLRQAQNVLRAGYGVFYPQVNAGLGASREKTSPALTGGTAPASIFNLFTLSASVGYVLDVFGGERRFVESLGAQADYQHAQLTAAYIILSGNVVNTMIARAAYYDQIKATEEIISLERDQIKITEAQAQAGLIPYANLLSLESQVAAVEATLPQLRQRLSQTDHLLAVLTGRTPGEWSPRQVELADLTLPGDLPLTLPSQLANQRPDILAAEAQLHAASAEIGVATAAMLPNITLSAAYGVGSNTPGNLIRSSNGFWNLGANVTAPLFRGGSLWYGRQAAIDAYQASAANYRQTVLVAFAQVADTLRAIEHDAELVQAELQALTASEEARRLIQANYEAGTANYVQVLIINSQYQQAKINFIQAEAQRFQDSVALFVALGGGWWNREDDAQSGLLLTTGSTGSVP
jgi:NodT family efflux transporter outer membrane factor (OMF) lipoprotein